MDFQLLNLATKLLEDLPTAWTFLLLVVRFGGLMMTIPGIGMGMQGMMVRYPAIMVLAMAALAGSPLAALPSTNLDVVVQLLSEVSFGFCLGLVPMLTIAGVQCGAQLMSTTIGLQASNLIDPTLNISSSDLGRIFGDISVLVFLSLGGHHVIVHVAASMGGQITPGSFFVGENTLDLLIRESGEIFRIGMLVSAPVIAALLLTNFVMGIISKMVPTVNIFIVSFPLTICIGLVLAMLMVPELIAFVTNEFHHVDRNVLVAVSDAK